MGTLSITFIGPDSITVESPDGHRWDFPVMILDDNRRCLAHPDFRAARDAAVGQNANAAAYTLAEAEAYRRRLIG